MDEAAGSGQSAPGCVATLIDDDFESLLINPDSPTAVRRRELRKQGMSWLEISRAMRMDFFRTMWSDKLPFRVHDQIVYYMRMESLVKIGTTRNIKGRVAALRPQGVIAVEFGAHDLERRRHKQFVHDHSHGEWFYLSPELWDHITLLRGRRHMDGLLVDEWLQLWMA